MVQNKYHGNGFEKIIKYIWSLGLEICAYEPCFSVKGTSSLVEIVILYDNHLLIAGTSVAKVDSSRPQLSQKSEKEDGGEGSFYIGLEIARECIHQTPTITRSEYAKRVRERFGI